jgi:hypothetical protein
MHHLIRMYPNIFSYCYKVNYHHGKVMERSEWMYKISRIAHTFMEQVTKFVGSD